MAGPSHSRHFAGLQNSVAVGGIADIGTRWRPEGSVACDPERKSRSQICCAAMRPPSAKLAAGGKAAVGAPQAGATQRFIACPRARDHRLRGYLSKLIRRGPRHSGGTNLKLLGNSSQWMIHPASLGRHSRFDLLLRLLVDTLPAMPHQGRIYATSGDETEQSMPRMACVCSART